MFSLFVDPAMRNYEMGTSEWFAAQQRMIKSKPLVKRCYDLWYKRLLDDVASVPAQYKDCPVLELGSGSSYIKELAPEVITSDVTPGLAERVIDGRKLPFADASLRGLLLTHVFHHIPEIEKFLSEAERVLVPGGVISMVECTHTALGKFFFSKMHPEPYDDHAPDWSFPQTNSMLDSNQALSWLVLFRDRKRFAEVAPNLVLERTEFLPWATYLLSGGVNLRSLVPQRWHKVVSRLDKLLQPLDPLCAIHWHLTLRKKV